jgi:hypothetical protein
MNNSQSDSSISDLRVCLRPPIPEITIAAGLLNDAVTAHIDGRLGAAASLIEQANMPAIMEWAKSLVGKYSEYNTPRFRLDSLSKVPVTEREEKRMPSPDDKNTLHQHYGYHCCFCGTPVIREQVQNRLLQLYGNSIPWVDMKEFDKHAAIYVMRAQYDHVIPYSRGGGNDLENLVLTCYPCNFGRSNNTLEEMGLLDPRKRKPVECVFSGWDGLERLLK